MKTKQKKARERLFRYSRPNIRPLEVLSDGDIGRDMAILWAAYRKGSFEDMEDMSQEDFTAMMFDFIGKYYSAWIVEDRNHLFPSDYGPVGMIVAGFNGWEMDPVYMPFKWATLRNSLRSVVAFLKMARYEKGVGVLNVFAFDNDIDFYKHVGKKYGTLYYVGKVARGHYGENKYIFYGRGGGFYKELRHGN